MAHIITNGSYEEFKLCAFRALDCARIAECVNALMDWATLMALFELKLTTETVEDGVVRLEFTYAFNQKLEAATISDTFLMLAGKTDTTVAELEVELEVGHQTLQGNDILHCQAHRDWLRQGQRGRVTFLLEVP